ncbi:MAG: DUF4339 domain-containing protein [Planctomycetales bacterium]|nr:DUF4339 domain-containing protein [Planctomycetales bacterium]
MTREWYFQFMGEILGPLSVPELKEKVANGQVQPDTLIRKGTEGDWLVSGRVKGLFPPPSSTPSPPPKPAPTKTTPAATPPSEKTATPPRPAGEPKSVPAADETLSVDSSSVPLATVASLFSPVDLTAHAPSVEFYDFVGFREAISPVLHDAVKKFAAERGMTMNQVNRRALAGFIGRPELASDVMITAVEVVPQPVNPKANRDGSNPLPERDQVERATFKVTLYNSSPHTVHVDDGAFLPEVVESRQYDQVVAGHPETIDHTQHVHALLKSPQQGKAIHVPLDCLLQPQEAKDVFVWFKAVDKPSVTKVRGQLLLGQGDSLAMSEYFTIVMHGDSPPQREEA